MSKRKMIKDLLTLNKGYITLSDVLDAGISKQYFLEYVKSLGLEKVARGIYMSFDAWPDEMYLMQLRYPGLVFSHETALFLHGLNDREPLTLSVTAKSGYNSTSLKEQSVRIFRVKLDFLKVGKTTIETPNGHKSMCMTWSAPFVIF